MSRTIRKFKGHTYPDKKRKEWKDKKHFGFTDGLHSHFAEAKKAYEDDGRESYKAIASRMGTYPVKDKDFVKYGYGNGTRKENRSKNYKREIE